MVDIGQSPNVSLVLCSQFLWKGLFSLERLSLRLHRGDPIWMRRLAILALLFGLLSFMPEAAARSPVPGKVARVALFDAGSETPPRLQLWKVFTERLRELGYVEGKHVVFERRWARGNEERLKSIARELAQLKVDAIVPMATTAAIAAKQATSTIPIVMSIVSNAVKANLIESLARPGGNVTGMSIQGVRVAAKRLELLNEIVPSATRLAILGAETYPNFAPSVSSAASAARRRGVSLKVIGIKSRDELDTAFASMSPSGKKLNRMNRL